jgi:8-amino-7-oxononanoate synthase
MPQINVLAISTSLDHMQLPALDRGRRRLLDLAAHTLRTCRIVLPRSQASLPESLHAASDTSLVSPIIPILSPQPHALSAFLRSKGYLARPIAYPTVAKGQERIRLCLHADNTQAEVNGLVGHLVAWCDMEDRKAKL